MGKINKEEEKNEASILDTFSRTDEKEMQEGTATYHKFSEVDEKFDGLFIGIEVRVFEEGKNTECAILKDAKGEQHLFAQTIIVNELKKKWNELQETGFPVRIIYKGVVKPGTADQYQTFRVLFAPKQ